MKDRAKKSRRFHPLSLRLICTEILAMLLVTVITAILSIVWYKDSVFTTIDKNDRVMATNLVHHYDREKSATETSAEWIPDGYVQDLFDWTTDASHTFYFLFDETGTCLICSGQVNCNRSEITLNLDVLNDVQINGEYFSNTLAMLNPKEPRPMISNGSPVTFTEPNGTETTYYLFSNTHTSVLDSFTSLTWIYGMLCFAVLTAALIAVTVFFLTRNQKPLAKMMQVAQQCARGNYTEHLNPGSFEEPSYEDMAYSINELAYAAENAENQRRACAFLPELQKEAAGMRQLQEKISLWGGQRRPARWCRGRCWRRRRRPAGRR